MEMRQDKTNYSENPSEKTPVHDSWAFGVKLGVAIFALLWLVAMGAVWSRADDSKGNDEYSFRWLDPEKKIYVLQNRRYTKSEKTMLTAMAGPGLSNPYRNTFSIEPRLAYYFSETFGIEGFFDKTFNSQNNTYQAMIATGTSIFPVVREISSEYGALAQWAPWYAKINVFNSIIYFDWYFEGGLGGVGTQYSSSSNVNNFTTQSEFALFAGTGMLFHLGDTFSVRLDFMGTYYKAPVLGATGSNVWFANYNTLLGLGARL